MTEETTEETTGVAEWAANIQDEGLRSTLGAYESPDAFFSAAGIEKPSAKEQADWREGLDDEELSKIAQRFNSPADALRSIQAFQKREGQVRVPGKDATDEERATYYKAIGVPESADKYEFLQIPEDQMTDEIKQSRDFWGEKLHSLKVPNETAKGLITALQEETQKIQAAQVEADKAFAESQSAALRAEWKGDYDKNMTLANRALSDLAEKAGVSVDELTKMETKDGRFLMDDARIARMFSLIGREMSEGTLGPALTESEAEGLESQIRDVRKEIEEAQQSGDSKRANALYQREQSLIAKRAGNKPIVGSHGRAA